VRYEDQDRAVAEASRLPADEAFEAIRDAVVDGDREAWVLYGDAVTYMANGNGAAAVVSLRESLRKDPGSPLALSLWLDLDDLAGRGTSGLAGSMAIIDAFPALARPRVDLGNRLLDRSEWTAAARCLSEAVEISPDDPHAWRVLAIARKKMGDSHGAADATRRYAVLTARRFGSQRTAATLLFACGAIREAWRLARTAGRLHDGPRGRILPFALPAGALQWATQTTRLMVAGIDVSFFVSAIAGWRPALALIALQILMLSAWLYAGDVRNARVVRIAQEHAVAALRDDPPSLPDYIRQARLEPGGSVVPIPPPHPAGGA